MERERFVYALWMFLFFVAGTIFGGWVFTR